MLPIIKFTNGQNWLGQGQAKVRSFFWDYYVGAAAQGLEPSFPGYKQTATREVEHLGHEPVTR